MATVVYYFTRTGKSERIAKRIANDKNAEAYKIDDGKDWKGFLGYIKAGYHASSKKSLPVQYRKPKKDDRIILCTPVWAGSFPPGVRTFIDKVGRNRIILVPSSMGSAITDRQGFIKVIDMIGKNEYVGGMII